MKKLSTLTMMVVTAASLAVTPVASMSPVVQELVTVMEVEAATRKVVKLTSYEDITETGKCKMINQTGSYTVEEKDTDDVFFGFKAPKAGTYVFKFKNVREKSLATDESSCMMRVMVGKLKPTKQNKGRLQDQSNPVYWSGYTYNKAGDKSQTIQLGSPQVCENRRTRATDAKTLEEYLTLPGEIRLTGTVKVKLKKGECLYFNPGYTRCVNLERNKGYVGQMDLNITMK